MIQIDVSELQRIADFLIKHGYGGWAVTIGDVIALIKEQEAVEPKKGHWIFESAYCEAWSHTCSECGKRMTTAYNTYANYCWNCGAKMEGR